MNRKLPIIPIILGLLAMVAVIVAAVKFATTFDQKMAFKSPARQTAEAETPRDRALADRAAAAEEAATADLDKPYEEAEYRAVPRIGSRVAIWVVAQLHLLFAAFVLAVPIFALIIEFIGYRTGDKRYDKLAYEFTKLLSVSFSFTATLGAALTFMLIILYPKFTNYLMSVFSPTFLPYVLLFFAEAGFLYSYYYGWGKFSPRVHLFLGLMLNVVGTALMFIANAWLTFMSTPAGIAESGALISTWEAVNNYTWMPINIHRIIANVAYGGSIAAAYAAFKFLQAKTDEERAHYDWMGYIGNFVAICGLLPLPFAGYWLASEIYAFSQTMGLTMMGGAFSWLFIIQAVLIGNLFLFANWYLWLGMGRIKGAERFRSFIWPMLVVITICFAIWATPRSILATTDEIQAMGGSSHPMLGYLGVMSAKNTAVNILILTTFLSFVLYRRSGRIPTVSWAKKANFVQFLIFVAAAATVIFYGIYGYFVDAATRISFSIPQVGSVLAALFLVTLVDVFLLRGAKTTETKWGTIRPISQYLLIMLAVTFTWLMGLMGYVRAGLRQHWHVFGVIRDTSPDAYTPTLGFATQVVSFTVLVFFLLLGFIFWLTSLSDKKSFAPLSWRRGSSGVVMKIPITLQLAVLTVLLTGFYMMVGQAVPQKEVQAPEVIEIAEDVSTEQMVEIGKTIYEGKGICFTCHANTSRYPDLQGIATRAATRKPGYSAIDYLAESLYEPGAYIVEGFSPGMPEVNKPPIGLTDPEVLSVIAYLQTLGGEATVTMDTPTAYTGGGGAPAGETAPAGGSVLDVHGCSRCHDAEQPTDPPSPSLVGVGSRLSAEQLLQKLYYHEGDDGLDQVTMVELEAMVRYLSEQKGEQG